MENEIVNALKDVAQQNNFEILLIAQAAIQNKSKPCIYVTNYRNLAVVFQESNAALVIQYEDVGLNSKYENALQLIARRACQVHSFHIFDSSVSLAPQINAERERIRETCLSWIRNFKFLLGKKDFISVEELKKIENIQIIEPQIQSAHHHNLVEKSSKSAMPSIIITDKIVEKHQLTEYLRDIFHINITERNSSTFSPTDVIISPKTCILVSNIDADLLLSNYFTEIEGICEKVVLLSQQFEYCYICLQTDSSQLPNMNSFMRYLTEWTNLIADKITMYILCSSSDIETAKLIDSIARASQSNQNSPFEWKLEETEQEAFLSFFSCMNYASAQLLLEKYKRIQYLLDVPLIELLNQFPIIPKTSLTNLYSVLHGIVQFQSYTHEDLSVVVGDLEQEADLEYELSKSAIETSSTHHNHSFESSPPPHPIHQLQQRNTSMAEVSDRRATIGYHSNTTPQHSHQRSSIDLRQQLLSQKRSMADRVRSNTSPKLTLLNKISPKGSSQKVNLAKIAKQFHFTPTFHSTDHKHEESTNYLKTNSTTSTTVPQKTTFLYDDSEDDVILTTRSKRPSNLNASKVAAPDIKSKPMQQKSLHSNNNNKSNTTTPPFHFERYVYTPKNGKHSASNSRGIEKKKRTK